jgi:hypothetical protein
MHGAILSYLTRLSLPCRLSGQLWQFLFSVPTDRCPNPNTPRCRALHPRPHPKRFLAFRYQVSGIRPPHLAPVNFPIFLLPNDFSSSSRPKQ